MMSETKYEPVRAKGVLGVKEPKDLYINTNGEVRITTDSQMDRIEKKMDKIIAKILMIEAQLSIKVDRDKIVDEFQQEVTRMQLLERRR